MTNRRSAQNDDPFGLGSYHPMKKDVLPQRVDVLRHYLYLRTFKYSKTTASSDLYKELYHTICSIYKKASIPVTKSQQRIISQIKELESKRKEINKKKNATRILNFKKYLEDIFSVIKKETDIPLTERSFYNDQCKNRKMMISSSIDKAQSHKIFRKAKERERLSASSVVEDNSHDYDSDVSSTSSTETDENFSSNADTTYEGLRPSASQHASSYFMQPLSNTADVVAQINIGEEQVAKLLTAYNQDLGLKQVVTKKKVSGQREKARKQRVEEIVQSSVIGK